MYSIEKRPTGLLLTFKGLISAEEMTKWANEAKSILAKQQGDFGVIVDMRKLNPLPADAQKIMVDTQETFRKKGMRRSAVVLESAITTSQFRRLAKQSGIDQWERYINSTATPNWADAAVLWVRDAVEPPA